MSIRRGAIERRATERLGLQERLDRPQFVEDLVPEGAWADGADELLDTLPAHQRDAVRMRVLEDLEYSDVARALGTTPCCRARSRPPRADCPQIPSHPIAGEPLMTRLDSDPDLERLGDALRASTTVDLARKEQTARSSGTPRRARLLRRPHALAGSTLGLAGVGAALVLALSAGGAAAPAAFAVTREANGSVLVTVNPQDTTQPWVLAADRKLASMGIDEPIGIEAPLALGPATVSPVSCTPLGGAATPSGPPVSVLFGTDGTGTIPAGNSGAGTVHLSGCEYYKSAAFDGLAGIPRGSDGTGNTGAG
jgi:hypothetical protein